MSTITLAIVGRGKICRCQEVRREDQTGTVLVKMMVVWTRMTAKKPSKMIIVSIRTFFENRAHRITDRLAIRYE
jgi:hypothetical protein